MILPSSFTIRKTGNLYQLRHKDFGTVFQSHNRKEFAKAHLLDPEHGAMTMRTFIHLTKDAYGGDNIRQLADAYKIRL